MADHDQDAGSRGEEEAPRDPTPGGRPSAPRDDVAPPPDTDITDGPGQETITDASHHESAETRPGRSYSDQPSGGRTFAGPPGAGPPGGGWATAAPPPPPRSDSFRDFIRQKPAQIIGAGLIGLIIGGVLGGGAVAVISGIVHDRDVARVHWREPAWERYPGYPGYRDCRPAPGGTYCRQQPPYVQPMPMPSPVPTMLPTGRPTPVATPTPMSPTTTG